MRPCVSRAASQSSKLSSSLPQEEKSGSVLIQQKQRVDSKFRCFGIGDFTPFKAVSHWTHVKFVAFEEYSSSSVACTVVPVSTGELD